MSPVTPPPTDAPQTLSERSAELIRQKITQGEFAPGQRLSEQALADSLGISRNTLREAFRMLTKDGLVKHAQNRGVFVAIPTSIYGPCWGSPSSSWASSCASIRCWS